MRSYLEKRYKNTPLEKLKVSHYIGLTPIV